MGLAEVLITAGGAALIALLAWFFFGSRRAESAVLRGGVQEVAITVKGGYSPSVIHAREGVPLRLLFDRQEASDCTARVVFPDFQVSKSLPAFGQATLEFTPDRSGEFGFACGMNMVHGTLVVDPPVAAGVLYPFIGLQLSPMIAAGAMALSSLWVVTNANRLRRWRSPAAG